MIEQLLCDGCCRGEHWFHAFEYLHADGAQRICRCDHCYNRCSCPRRFYVGRLGRELMRCQDDPAEGYSAGSSSLVETRSHETR